MFRENASGIPNREHGQTFGSIMCADRGFKRISSLIIAILREEQDLLLLATMPDDGIGVCWVKANLGETHAAQLQHLPKLAPRFALHACYQVLDVTLNIFISQKR